MILKSNQSLMTAFMKQRAIHQQNQSQDGLNPGGSTQVQIDPVPQLVINTYTVSVPSVLIPTSAQEEYQPHTQMIHMNQPTPVNEPINPKQQTKQPKTHEQLTDLYSQHQEPGSRKISVAVNVENNNSQPSAPPCVRDPQFGPQDTKSIMQSPGNMMEVSNGPQGVNKIAQSMLAQVGSPPLGAELPVKYQHDGLNAFSCPASIGSPRHPMPELSEQNQSNVNSDVDSSQILEQPGLGAPINHPNGTATGKMHIRPTGLNMNKTGSADSNIIDGTTDANIQTNEKANCGDDKDEHPNLVTAQDQLSKLVETL